MGAYLRRKIRVALAEFKHETNCFCPNKAGRKEYEEQYLKEADEILSFFKDTRTEIGGMTVAAGLVVAISLNIFLRFG